MSVAQTVFFASILSNLAALAPNGLVDIKDRVGNENLDGALMRYDNALTQEFYIPVALTLLGLVRTVGLEWRSVKRNQV